MLTFDVFHEREDLLVVEDDLDLTIDGNLKIEQQKSKLHTVGS